MFAYVIFLLYICRKFIAMSETQFSQISEAQDMGITLQIAEGLQAGFPSPAQDYAGETIDLAREMVRHPESTFYARKRATACEMQEFIMVI